MSSEKTDALVIRLADFSNTSRVVTFFSRDFGRISAIAKGGKRLKGPFDSALDLLSNCGIVFIRKSGQALNILTEARLHARFRPANRDMNSYYAGCYVAELLAGLTEDHDPHPGLFDAASEVLEQFGRGVDYRLPLCRFELVLLREIGLLLSFDECMRCGVGVAEDCRYAFWMSQGGLLCSECGHEEFSQHTIHAGTVALMKYLVSGSARQSENLTASIQQIKELRFSIAAAVSSALGRRPGTLRYLQF